MENYTEFKKLNLNEKINWINENVEQEICEDYLIEKKDLTIMHSIDQVIDVIVYNFEGVDLMRELSQLNNDFSYYHTEIFARQYDGFECYDNFKDLLTEFLDDDDANEIYKEIKGSN